MKRFLSHSLFTAATVLTLLGLGTVSVHTQGPFSAQIQRAIRQLTNGTTPFTIITLVSGGSIKTVDGNLLLHFNGGGGGGSVYENTALGYQAGNALTGTGYANTLIGRRAGASLNGTAPAGTSNTLIGYGAASNLTTGSFNTVVGTAAADALTTQQGSTYLGYHAGINAVPSSGGNTVIGNLAGRGAAGTATGLTNTCVGDNCLAVYTTAQLNAGLGASIMEAATTASNSTAIGFGALRAVTTGQNNTCVGYACADALVDGSTNVIVGYNIDTPATNTSNYANFAGSYIATVGTLAFHALGAPTVTSLCGATPVVTGTAASFTLNVGTGGTATGCVLTIPAPAATNGWACTVTNRTAVAANRLGQWTVQTAATTNTVTIQNQTIATGAALAFTASDIVAMACLPN